MNWKRRVPGGSKAGGARPVDEEARRVWRSGRLLQESAAGRSKRRRHRTRSQSKFGAVNRKGDSNLFISAKAKSIAEK